MGARELVVVKSFWCSCRGPRFFLFPTVPNGSSQIATPRGFKPSEVCLLTTKSTRHSCDTHTWYAHMDAVNSPPHTQKQKKIQIKETYNHKQGYSLKTVNRDFYLFHVHFEETPYPQSTYAWVFRNGILGDKSRYKAENNLKLLTSLLAS